MLGVIDLPDSNKNIIVSSMVLDNMPLMANVYAPDTGSTAIRNDKNQIIAVTRLRSK